MKEKKKILGIAISAILLISAISTVLWLYYKQPGSGDAVAVIDNETVTVQEFKQQILLIRGEVIAYFREKYGAEPEQGFWTNSYEGEIPSEIAKNRAMKQVIKNKEQLILAKEQGLIQDLGYKAILKGMKTENKRRKDAVESGEVIYGQLEYSDETYFQDVMTKLEENIKKNMSGQWNITDEEIKNYYNKIKDDFYAKGQKVTIKKIQLSYVNEDGTVSSELKNTQKDRIDEIMKQLKSGADFDSEVSKLKDGVEVSEQIFDIESAASDAKLNPNLREISLGMKQGEISDISEEGNSFYIVKCLDNIILSYIPLDEVKDNIKSICIDDKYKALIETLSAKAAVNINKKVYDKMDKMASLV